MPRRNEDQEIWLTKPPRTPYWVIRFRDPVTQKMRQRSTGTENKKEAERLLGELRADLLKHRVEPHGNTSWAEFRRRYESDYLPSLALKTQLKIGTVLDRLEMVVNPLKLRDLTSERLSFFQAELRSKKLAESTIAGYLAHLKAALRWGYEIGMLHVLPKIPKTRRAKNSKVMKGRPITATEFQAMLDQVEGVVGKDCEPWKQYLRGLWWSGLRLAESLELYWDDSAKLCVVLEGDDLMLRIPAELEKGNKDRLLPIAPEFAAFLSAIPKAERTSRVFKLPSRTRIGQDVTEDRVIKLVGRIGRAANVLVDSAKKKYASAHDFRRSFGERWAALVMPAVLMELMRHDSIETTLKYYVGQNAQRTTKVLREAYERAQEQVKKQAPPVSNETEPKSPEAGVGGNEKSA